MKDERKTKRQLIDELVALRQKAEEASLRVAELEALGVERAQTEEALRESEERYRLMSENIPVVVYSALPDEHSTNLFLSGRAEELTGYSCDEFLSDSTLWGRMIFPEDETEVWEAIEAHRKSKTMLDVEYRIVRKDGTVKWIRDKATPVLKDGDGELIRIDGFMEDVSERKQAEQGLLQHNRSLTMLNEAGRVLNSTLQLDHVLNVVLEEVRQLLGIVASSIWLTDVETGELVCRQVTGPQRDLVLGWRLSPGEGIAGWVAREGESLIVPDTHADERYFGGVDEQTGLTLRSIISVPLEAREEVIGVLQVVDTEVGQFDEQDLTLVELLAGSAATAIENSRLYSAAQEEIAERKRVQQALLRERDRAQTYLDIAGVMFVALDTKGTVTLVNEKACEIMGYTEEEIVGLNWFDHFIPERLKDELRGVSEKLLSGELEPAEYFESPVVARDGEERLIAWHNSFLYDKEGVIIGTLSSGEDITERRQAEQALQESEARYRGLFEGVPVGLYRTTVEGRILDANPALVEMLGYPDLESLMMEPSSVMYVNPQDQARWRALLENAGRVRDFEVLFRRRDGTPIWVKETARAVHDSEGRVVHYEGAMEDITERKRAEQLLEALNRAASAMEGILKPEEIFVAVAKELEMLGFHCLVFLAGERQNTLYPRYLSYEPGLVEIVEKLTGIKATEFPVSLDRVEVFGQVVRERRTFFIEDAEAAARDLLPGSMKRLAKQIVGILKVPRYIAAPLIVEDEVVGVLTVQSDDLTEDDVPAVTAFAHQMAAAWRRTQLYQELERYAERLEARVQERTVELQAQYAWLEAILASTSDGIVATDESGEIVHSNPVAQAWLTQTLSPEDAERLRKAVQGLALRAGELPEEILELAGLDLQLNAAPISEPGAKESVAVVAVHDVSYLKAVDRLKSRFVSNVSHQLRTPITTIKLLAALIRKQPDRWEEYLGPLEQEAERQAQLVEDILEISRIDVGRMEVEPRPLLLNDLTDGTVMAHQVLAQNRGLALEHRAAEPGPVALVDPEQMMKVLNNLVENGLNYTPRGGRVIVSTGTEEGGGRVWATVTVADTGIGIPADELPHVLERFFRGAEPREMQVPGTGLGLAIANEIVELHGGWVKVESQVGEGSTFTVYLPLA